MTRVRPLKFRQLLGFWAEGALIYFGVWLITMLVTLATGVILPSPAVASVRPDNSQAFALAMQLSVLIWEFLWTGYRLFGRPEESKP